MRLVNWSGRVIAAGSEVTMSIEEYVCFLRNVLGASLFTQALLHFCKGRVRSVKLLKTGFQLSQAEVLRLGSSGIS